MAASAIPWSYYSTTRAWCWLVGAGHGAAVEQDIRSTAVRWSALELIDAVRFCDFTRCLTRRSKERAGTGGSEPKAEGAGFSVNGSGGALIEPACIRTI